MFLSFLKIGAFTIGGGLAMLPLIEREFVVRRRWVDHDGMVDILAVAQTLPGVIALNTSLIVGYRTRGFAGALAAAAGMVLPSFLIILAIAGSLTALREQDWARRAFAGVRAGVTALILVSVLRMGRRVLTELRPALIALAAFAALSVFDVHFIFVVAGAAIAGLAPLGWHVWRAARARKAARP
jgi:chromate transporter